MSGDDTEAADAGSVAYELVGWTTAQRNALELLLTGREIPYEWERARVVVPAARADEVHDLFHGLGPERPPAGPVGGEPSSGVSVDSGQNIDHAIAGPGRRLLGTAVDIAVWAVVDAGLSYTSPFGDHAALAHRVTEAGAIAAYEIVSVALWGRTIGKLVAGTRIVPLNSGVTPGWSRAILRWAVPFIASLTSLLFEGAGLPFGLAFIASGVLTLVVYVGVLQAPLRQGVHDKIAGTVVVLVPRATENAVDRASTGGSIGEAPPAPW